MIEILKKLILVRGIAGLAMLAMFWIYILTVMNTTTSPPTTQPLETRIATVGSFFALAFFLLHVEPLLCLVNARKLRGIGQTVAKLLLYASMPYYVLATLMGMYLIYTLAISDTTQASASLAQNEASLEVVPAIQKQLAIMLGGYTLVAPIAGLINYVIAKATDRNDY